MHGGPHLSRTMDDPVSGLESVLQPNWDSPIGRPESSSPVHPRPDRNVLGYLDGGPSYFSRPVIYTVAGRVHRYSCFWAYFPDVSRDCGYPCNRPLICVDGYRNGYCGHEGLTDNLQSSTMVGLPEALEVAAPRSLGCERTLHHLHEFRKVSRSGVATELSYCGPGQVVPVLCVVVGQSFTHGRDRHAISPRAVNRCDLIIDRTDSKHVQRVYFTSANDNEVSASLIANHLSGSPDVQEQDKLEQLPF